MNNLDLNCGDDCLEIRHLLIERDYENYPYGWMVVVGSHQELVDAIRLPLEAYNEMVDDESMFFLQPLREGTIDDLAGAIVMEVAEAEEQEEEELARQASDQFQTTP